MAGANRTDIKIFIYDTDPSRVDFVRDTLGVSSLNSIGEVVENCGIVFIAVKPYSVESVLEVAAGALNNLKNYKNIPLFISIAGGVKVAFMEEVLNKTLKNNLPLKIFRVMPNINSLAGKGMSAICYNGNVSPKDIETALEILEMSSLRFKYGRKVF
jgi:Pyrroline-5-carboxylate reductase